MRLPWVSRELYEREKDWTTRLALNLDALQRRYHELAVGAPVDERDGGKLLKYAQAVASDHPASAQAVQAIQKRSVIAQTIADEAQGDERTARYLWKRAAELKQENKTPEEIAKELRRWQSTEVEE